MKRTLFLMLSLLVTIVACKEKELPMVAVTSVELDSSHLTLSVGESEVLIATVLPSDAADKSVVWFSNDESIATVSDGKVTAISPGTTAIKVKTIDGGKTASCNITVKAKVYAVEGISLDKTSAELVEGETLTLTATVSPDNATNKNVTWSSSDESVATVADRKVTAIKAGTATITVKTEDGGKTASCAVTVNAKVYSVESVSLDKTSAELVVGETLTLTATVSPDNATNKNATWSSSDESVATVADGKVTAIKAGTATITVKTEDGGKTASCAVTVNAKVYSVESVSLDKTSAELVEGETLTLTATISPDNATNKNVTWSSSDESVATVADGKVTAIKAGTATITVTTEDGSRTASCMVTVNKKVYSVESVSLDKTSAELIVGSELSLKATISPSNATNKNVEWSSSDESVAIVSSSGKVKAIKAGTATITVNTVDGNKTAVCYCTIYDKPIATNLQISQSSFIAYINETYSINVDVYPEDATYDLQWSSSDESIAVITSVNGKTAYVETKDYGNTNVIVTDKQSGLTASIDLKTCITEFEWTDTTTETYAGFPLITIEVGQSYKLNCKYSPDNATNVFRDLSQFVFYESNVVETPEFISISENGLVTGVKAGTTGIKPTGRIIKGGGPERIYIMVKEIVVPVTGISLCHTVLDLIEGDEFALSAVITPENATNQNVIWTSSDEAVATVSTDGLVTAINSGTAIISAKCEDGGKEASCEVIVKHIVSGGIEGTEDEDWGILKM